MECKLIDHGMAIGYNQVVKPCCIWQVDKDWKNNHHVSQVNLVNWHKHPDLVEKRNQLKSNKWPANCQQCANTEMQGRHDSIRGNGNSAYNHYQPGDITLEIRPGSVCNFACQTCWPAASSRVAQYHSQAGLIDIKNVDSHTIDNFDFLLPVANRIKNVVLLGGEPFYDKSCKKFLEWSQQYLRTNLLMFTNGSTIDFDFLKKYQGKITLVFSLDATGRAAEYIRFGTIWEDVLKNYKLAKKLVNTRVNITCSVYNYHHIESVIELLTSDWPEVVSFGTPFEDHLSVQSIPLSLRPDIKTSLDRAINLVTIANIEHNQKQNAINALQNIIDNLQTTPWDKQCHRRWCEFVEAMDRVKKINVKDYCSTLGSILDYVDQVS